VVRRVPAPASPRSRAGRPTRARRGRPPARSLRGRSGSVSAIAPGRRTAHAPYPAAVSKCRYPFCRLVSFTSTRPRRAAHLERGLAHRVHALCTAELAHPAAHPDRGDLRAGVERERGGASHLDVVYAWSRTGVRDRVCVRVTSTSRSPAPFKLCGSRSPNDKAALNLSQSALRHLALIQRHGHVHAPCIYASLCTRRDARVEARFHEAGACSEMRTVESRVVLGNAKQRGPSDGCARKHARCGSRGHPGIHQCGSQGPSMAHLMSRQRHSAVLHFRSSVDASASGSICLQEREVRCAQ
jgi:hypothetical protein